MLVVLLTPNSYQLSSPPHFSHELGFIWVTGEVKRAHPGRVTQIYGAFYLLCSTLFLTSVGWWELEQGISCLIQFSNTIQPDRTHYSTVLRGSISSLRGYAVQPADIGWPTGNRKKLSSTQAQLGQATSSCLVSFHFLWAILCPQAVETAVKVTAY